MLRSLSTFWNLDNKTTFRHSCEHTKLSWILYDFSLFNFHGKRLLIPWSLLRFAIKRLRSIFNLSLWNENFQCRNLEWNFDKNFIMFCSFVCHLIQLFLLDVWSRVRIENKTFLLMESLVCSVASRFMMSTDESAMKHFSEGWKHCFKGLCLITPVFTTNIIPLSCKAWHNTW